MRSHKGIAIVLAPVAAEMRLVGLDLGPLKADIEKHGLQKRILVNAATGEVVEGKRRAAALHELGIPITEDMIQRI